MSSPLWLLWMALCCNAAVVNSQLAWTPIYLGSNSQVDLWTQESQGCRCNHDSARTDCACCVPQGGCQCGALAPNRCAQCGLEQHCTNMCNITIKADTLLARSNSTFGQIKSPVLSGPNSCWYTLDPGRDKRVELQVYRLVNTGHFNGSSCVSGYLELIDSFGSQGTGPRICGLNERFTPPVVMFADRESAMLNFRIEEKTSRSQFLAYFSFTSLTNAHGLMFKPKGGRRIEHAACDWLYQDFSCTKSSCTLASPGFPGIYGTNLYCKYHITTSSANTKVRIQFHTLSLPLNHCGTHYVNVYEGPASNSHLLTTICDNSKKDYTFPGPNVLLEFRAGAAIPPYDYTGFVATIEFIDDTVTPPTSTVAALEVTPSYPSMAVQRNAENDQVCDVTIKSTDVKSGHFDLRTARKNCTIRFVGKQPEIVQISLFNYVLKASSCQSFIEIYDGSDITRSNEKIKRMCSPVEKHARDTNGRFQERQMFVSSGTHMTLFVRRLMAEAEDAGTEFLDGAYSFFNVLEKGTLQPDTLCDVNYNGLSSSSRGKLKHPGTEQVFWNVEGQMRCSQNLIPAVNQSISIKVISLNKLSSNLCYTECGDGGCRCVKNATSIVDQLYVTSVKGDILSCICGDFQAEWLPVTVKSWSPINLAYSISKYSWSNKGFEYSAEYSFKEDVVCGYRVINQHTGFLESPVMIRESPLNFYYHQDCTWLLDSNVERHLTIEIGSSQSRPCSAWNISIHEYSKRADDRAGPVLYTFCSREKNSTNTLPWQTNVVVIKLRAMTQTPPQYYIKWRSDVDRAARPSGSTAHTAAASGSSAARPTEIRGFWTATASVMVVSMYAKKLKNS